MADSAHQINRCQSACGKDRVINCHGGYVSCTPNNQVYSKEIE
jgi:hypothetical protein